MNYFLDTNICIYFLNGTHAALKKRLLAHHPQEICVPSIVRAELYYGASKSLRRQDNLRKVEQFLFPFKDAVFDNPAAVEYGRIRATLETNGKSIGPNDLIIAATVVSADGILVTHNTAEFQRIPGLKLEDWAI